MAFLKYFFVAFLAVTCVSASQKFSYLYEEIDGHLPKGLKIGSCEIVDALTIDGVMISGKVTIQKDTKKVVAFFSTYIDGYKNDDGTVTFKSYVDRFTDGRKMSASFTLAGVDKPKPQVVRLSVSTKKASFFGLGHLKDVPADSIECEARPTTK